MLGVIGCLLGAFGQRCQKLREGLESRSLEQAFSLAFFFRGDLVMKYFLVKYMVKISYEAACLVITLNSQLHDVERYVDQLTLLYICDIA